MRRREFIAGLGSAAAWPVVAWAQEPDRVRRIGVLTGFDENDPLSKSLVSAFTQALADLGWTDGGNVRMDVRLSGVDIDRIRALAHELVGLQPDIVLAGTRQARVALERETRTIPIVYASVIDSVTSGLVARRLDRPGGNITGFATTEDSLGGKWLELLSEIAPGLKRAAIMYDRKRGPVGYMGYIQAAARSLKIVLIYAPVDSDVEIETATVALGREPGSGLVVIPDAFTFAHRAPIISAAARNNVPAVSWLSDFARNGGLLSYGVDVVGTFRGAATYVDRILRGAKPEELPIHYPTKFEMAVNLKTARALGLTVPRSILLRADEVIE